jgi:hypothetical protein
VPENKAFWSITLYGSDGYMKSEDIDNKPALGAAA